MKNNVGVLGGVKKFVDLIVDDDNNESESDCFIENVFVEVNTSPVEDNVDESLDKSHLHLDESLGEEQETNQRMLRSTAIRDTVNNAQGVNAEKMKDKHDAKRNKVTREFKVGDHVSVKKDKIDKGSSELARVPCVITDERNNKFQLTTEFGILENLRRADDLEPYHGLIEFEANKITETISLRTVCIRIAKRNKPIKEIEIECNCTGNCDKNQCKCFKNGQKCHSHCHTKKENKCCKNGK